MHKPLPGRLINAALPGPCARQFGLIGIATCADLARVEGMLCRGKCVARLPRDGPCVQPGSWWDPGCSVKRCEQPSAGWVRLRVAPCRVEPVTVKVAPCGPALTDFVPWGSSVPPRLGCKCAWWDLEITQSGTQNLGTAVCWLRDVTCPLQRSTRSCAGLSLLQLSPAHPLIDQHL